MRRPASIPGPARPARPGLGAARLDLLFVATLGTLTWETMYWHVVASLTLSNLLTLSFVAAFVLDRVLRRDGRLHPAAITLLGFALAFAAVYLAGYFDLANRDALVYWVKGMAVWVAHFSFLVCGVAHIVRRGRPLFMRGLRWFLWGVLVNCAYGVAQLAAQVGGGVNLDRLVIGRITSASAHGLNVYGQVGGSGVYRLNALTTDTNHLGVMLCTPLLVGLAHYLGAPRRRRMLGLALLLMLGCQVLTLSRSAALGDAAGLLVLYPMARGYLPRPRTLALGAAALALATFTAVSSSHYLSTVVASRLQVSNGDNSTHLLFYQLVPPALSPNPLFGMGVNTFAVYFQFLTGRPDFGAHSIWVTVIVETGMVGFSLYLAFLGYLLTSAWRVRLSADEEISRLGLGFVAALIGTAAANFFYLTMTFDYFFAACVLVVGGAALFAPARRPRVRRAAPAELGVTGA
ncbi:MAG TPA: O-antigen ligase family protein [Gaiellales bacterium]|nr:O-antigen ligase family protein [Gaiellales bacterium]